jgi:hypothetical protein
MRTFVVALIALAACSSTSPLDPSEDWLPGRPIEFRRDPAFQWHRSFNGIDHPGTSVIRDAAEWESVWARITARSMPKTPAPAIDFSKEMVVFVALGSRSSGGYAAEVVHVVATNDGIGVDYVATSPGENCLTIGAFTQPIDLVIVRRVEGSAAFKRRDRTSSC